jgi:agmatinase
MYFMDFQTELEKAKIVIIPIPHEKITSYGKGTKKGPEAILKASHELENYDIETKEEPYLKGIYTEKPTDINNIKQYKDKFIIALGGEHSITPNIIKTLPQENLSILHIDAHADLKDIFDNSKNSHACAMRRTFEINKNITQVGIRSQSKEELNFAQNNNIKQLNINDNILENLKENVYITLDLDALDPKEMPAVGTPEPDGLIFKEVKQLLKQIFQNKNVIGMDVTELSPKEGDLISPYTAAKLIYHCIAYKFKNTI